MYDPTVLLSTLALLVFVGALLKIFYPRLAAAVRRWREARERPPVVLRPMDYLPRPPPPPPPVLRPPPARHHRKPVLRRRGHRHR